MKTTIKTIAAILLTFNFMNFITICHAQITFQKTFGGSNEDYGNSVQQTADCGYIVAGYYNKNSGNTDVYLIKTDGVGSLSWAKTYGGSGNDQGNKVEITSDGGYIVAGFATGIGAGGEDFYLIKTNASGTLQWSKLYGGTGNERAISVKQTSDGGYIIIGYTNSFGAGGQDIYVVKINATGDTTWTRTYGGTNEELGYDIQQTSDGGYILCGTTQSYGAGARDTYLLKINAAGTIQWTKTYGGSNHDEGTSIQITTDGGYVIAGYTFSYGAGNDDCFLVKTDASGNLSWAKTYGWSGYDSWISSVQQTTDGGFIIGSMTYMGATPANGYEIYLIKTMSNGNLQWSKAFGTTSYDEGVSVIQTTDGGYAVCGYSQNLGTTKQDVYLVKTDVNGNSGCNEQTISTTVTSPTPSVSSGGTTGSGGTVTTPTTNVGSGGTETSLCKAGNTTVTINTTGSPYCLGDNSDTLAAAPSGGVWKGNGITDTLKGIFNPSTAGIGTHTITYTLTGGCGGFDTEDVIVNAGKDATITPPGSFCPSDAPVTLQAATTGGTWTGTGVSSGGVFTPANAGYGTHIITYTFSGTCGSSDTVKIQVDSAKDATITPVAPVCSTQPAFNLTAANPNGTWTGNGITDTLNGTFSPALSGYGTHSITYTINGACGDTDSVNITVLNIPTLTLSPTDVSCPDKCDGNILVTASGSTPPYFYQWDANTGNQTDSTAASLCPDNYTITVTDSNQCSAVVNATVGTNASVTADFIINPETTTINNTQITFTDNSAGAVNQWLWYFYDKNKVLMDSGNTSDMLLLYPKEVGIYPVTLWVSDGNCSDDTTQYVVINGEYVIYIPNAFTPNGDDNNDTFFPKGIGIHPTNYKLYIFDRWGELIFESDDLYTYWDGTYKGEMVQNGVYIWKIITEEETLNKEKHAYIGHVTVLK